MVDFVKKLKKKKKKDLLATLLEQLKIQIEDVLGWFSHTILIHLT